MPITNNGWPALARQRKRQAQHANEPCCLCGKPIPYGTAYRIPMGDRIRINPWYPTVEHHDHRALGGDDLPPLDRLGVAHYYCQSVQGQWLRTVTIARRRHQQPPPPPRYTGPTGTPPPPPPAPKPKPKQDRFLRPTPKWTPADVRGSISPEGWPLGVPLPRFMSERHPDAVGSLGDEAMVWIRARRAADPTVPDDAREPLPWWGVVLDRALEVDAAGRLCWRQVVVTVPRQSGKSTLLGEVLLWRAHQADRFGEPQVCAHVANNLQAAFRTQEDVHVWARENGLRVRLRTGQERVEVGAGSMWTITSLSAAYGLRASLAVLDEAFDVAAGPVEKALLPTQARRVSPQAWLVSTANSECTDLMPKAIRRARGGSKRVCLFDWGLPDGADPGDESLWPLANPFPTSEYLAEVAAARDTEDWAGQWLNVWPPVEDQAEDDTPQGWIDRAGWDVGQVDRMPEAGRVTVAVESSVDGAGYAVCRAVKDGDRVTVEAAEFDSLADVRGQVQAWFESGAHLVCGKSLIGFMAPQWQAQPVTQAQFAEASTAFRDAAGSGILGHMPHPGLDDQVCRMQLKGVGQGGGSVLTGKGVYTARCAVWAVWGALARRPEAFVI